MSKPHDEVEFVYYSPITVPPMMLATVVMGGLFVGMGQGDGDILVILIGFGFILTIAGMLIKLIVWRGRAVTIRNGRLIYQFLQPHGVALADMKDIAVDIENAHYLSYRAVVLTKRDGAKTSFPAWSLQEDADAIVERLRAACGLPQDPNAGTPGG